MENSKQTRDRIRNWIPRIAGLAGIALITAFWQYGPVWVVQDGPASHQPHSTRQSVRLSGDPALDVLAGTLDGMGAMASTVAAGSGFIIMLVLMMFIGGGGALLIWVCASNSIEGHCMSDNDREWDTIPRAIRESKGHAIAYFVAFAWMTAVALPLAFGMTDSAVADCPAKCVVLSGNAWLK